MTREEREWWYRQGASLAAEALRRNGFEAAWFEDRAKTLTHILKMVPQGAVIGFGDSVTLREIGLSEALADSSCELINPPAVETRLPPEEKRELRRCCFTADLFFSGANAITLDGKVVNVDGTGNRVAATIFGPQKVIIVAGANKVVDDLEEALERMKGIAAPMNARRIGYETPCGRTGICNECRSPERMCRVTVILDRPTKATETTVIIIGEELGF